MKIISFILEEEIIFYHKKEESIETFNIKGNTSLKFQFYDYYEIFGELKEKLRIENKIPVLNDSIGITFYYRNELDEEIEEKVIEKLEYKGVKVEVKEFEFNKNKTNSYELYCKLNDLFLDFLSKKESSRIAKTLIYENASKVIEKNKNNEVFINRNRKINLDENIKLFNIKNKKIYSPYKLSAIITNNGVEYLVPQNSLNNYVSNEIITNNPNKKFKIHNWLIKPSRGKTSLIYAVINEQLRLVDKLIKSGAELDAQDNFGRTSLIWATLTFQSKIVERLLKNKINLNIKDNTGQSALHWAVILENFEVTKLLIKFGADVRQKNRSGLNALDLAKSYNYSIEYSKDKGENWKNIFDERNFISPIYEDYNILKIDAQKIKIVDINQKSYDLSKGEYFIKMGNIKEGKPAINTAAIYYKNEFPETYIYYSKDGGESWTEKPGRKMLNSIIYEKYNVINIDLKNNQELKFAFNDGEDNWDNNEGKDYIANQGVTIINQNKIKKEKPAVEEIIIYRQKKVIELLKETMENNFSSIGDGYGLELI